MKNEPVKSLERELKLEGGRGDTAGLRPKRKHVLLYALGDQPAANRRPAQIRSQRAAQRSASVRPGGRRPHRQPLRESLRPKG